MNLKTSVSTRSAGGTIEPVADLLRGLIDYAGLFPPAGLGMAPAVGNYTEYLKSEFGWVLGRFIVPTARLREFEVALGGLRDPQRSESRWVLSALLGADAAAELAQIREFNDRFAKGNSFPKARIESVEVKVASVEEIKRLSGVISREIGASELETYFEIPSAGNERCCVAAVAACGRRAKVRTGGETADKFPSAEKVIEFMQLCAEFDVAFKATAGLHHPLRSVRQFTYDAESPSGMMHGFLNVFLAAAFLRLGMEASLAVEVLGEQSPEAFHFDSESVLWREHRLGVADITAARRGFSISFGSCSFTEPVDDLRALHLL